MTEEVGLIVRAKMVPDRWGMERIAKETTQATKKATANVERSIKGIMPKSLGGLFSGGMKVEKQLNKTMPKGGGGFLGRIGGFANRMGAGSGVGNAAVAGAVGGIMASAMNGVMGLLKKGLSVLVESSGSLRNVLKLLNMGFLQIIRPFADVLAIMLRPIAMFFRIIGREVMKRVRAKRQELKGQGLSGIALGGALMAELPSIYLDVLMEQLGKIDWGTFFSKILSVLWENLTVRLPAFLGKVFEILNGLGNWIWENIILAIGNLATTELAKFGLWIWTEIVKALGTAVTWVANMFEGAASFGAWLFNEIKKAIGSMSDLNGLAKWIKEQVQTAATSNAVPGSGIVTAVTGNDYMGASLTTGLAVVKKGMEDLYNSIGGRGQLIPGLATGGEVLTTGLVNMHRGEVAQNKGELLRDIKNAAAEAVNGGGQPIQVNVVIPGAVMRAAMIEGTDKYYRERVVSRR